MEKITDYLLRKNLKPHLKGFYYLGQAIELILSDKQKLFNVCKKIYRYIGNRNKEKSSNVERSMRTSLKNATIKMTISEFLGRSYIELTGGKI